MARFLMDLDEKYVSVFSCVEVFRNLKNFKFSGNLTVKEEIEIFNKICTEFYKLYYSDKFRFYKLNAENRNLLKNLDNFNIGNRKNYFFGDNSYIFRRDDGCLNFYINTEEHLKISSTLNGVNFLRCGQIVYTLEEDLEKNLEFSFNTNFGYVFKNIDLCGNGLSINGLLHLPILSYYGFNSSIIDKLNENGIVFNRFTEMKKIYGDDFYLISCNIRNEDEFSLFRKMDKFVKEIVKLEIENRKKLSGIKIDYYRNKLEKYTNYLKNSNKLTEYIVSKYISLVLLLQSLEIVVGYDYNNLIENFLRLEDLKNLKEEERKEKLLEISRALLKG